MFKEALMNNHPEHQVDKLASDKVFQTVFSFSFFKPSTSENNVAVTVFFTRYVNIIFISLGENKLLIILKCNFTSSVLIEVTVK